MRNDVKPVIPGMNKETAPEPQETREPEPRPDHAGDVPGPAGEGDFDREHGSSVHRERGDSVDPAGPKQSSVPGSLGTGGAVTDPSGTTGTVSRSNDRMSTTTGRLHDPDLERSARQGEAPDVNVLDISTADSSFSVPVLMAALAGLIAILGLVLFLTWSSEPVEPVDEAAPAAEVQE